MRKSLASLHSLVWTSLLAAFISSGAFLAVHIGPVPITAQVLFVLLSAYILGSKRAMLCIVLYLSAGLVGLPVFSGGTAGFAHLFGPSGGYLLGFLPAVAVAGMANKKRALSWFSGIFWGFLALGTIYIFGLVWLKYCLEVPWSKALVLGLYPYIVWDILKMFTAVACYKMLDKSTLLPQRQ